MITKYKIALRQDGWFDAGKNAEHYCIRSVYSDLQAMKKSIDEIGPKKSLSGLEKALKSTTSIPAGFGGKPYLHNMKVYIPSSNSAYPCPIGKVVRVTKKSRIEEEALKDDFAQSAIAGMEGFSSTLRRLTSKLK